MMINNISQLNNIKYYKSQNKQKISTLSFKADSVEINDNDNDKLKYLGLILGCILAFIAGTQASIILECFGYKIGLCNRRK